MRRPSLRQRRRERRRAASAGLWRAGRNRGTSATPTNDAAAAASRPSPSASVNATEAACESDVPRRRGAVRQRRPRRRPSVTRPGGLVRQTGRGVLHPRAVQRCDQRADDGDTERARDLPRDVVHRGSDSRLRLRHRAHDGVGRRPHNPADPECEPEEPESERPEAGRATMQRRGLQQRQTGETGRHDVSSRAARTASPRCPRR